MTEVALVRWRRRGKFFKDGEAWRRNKDDEDYLPRTAAINRKRLGDIDILRWVDEEEAADVQNITGDC